jgi:hypothetical protein
MQSATMRSSSGSVEPLSLNTRDWLMQALQLDQWESFASPTDAREALDDAFGTENNIVELAALQVFLARYAATDVPTEPDLGPRLEAMKAFLARYPSRRGAEKAEPETSEEVLSPPPPAAEPASAVATPEPTPPPAPAPPPPPERPRVDMPAITIAEALEELEPEAELPRFETTGAIPSYAEERRGATPVRARYRMRLIAAALGVVLLLGAIGALLYFRGGGSAAATGTLSVTTLPAGIAVFVDGKPHGVTPLGVELPAGEHVVELRTDTEQRRIPITMTVGGQVSQYLELARTAQASGELLVRTEPIGAAVTVDGNFVGRSPVSVPDLSPGTHTVVMQLNGETQTERVIIEDGRTASLVVSLGGGAAQKAAAGWVRIDVPADVQVFENGRLVGSSDFERIMLPVGRHELELVNEQLDYRERRAVQIAAGQTSTVRPEWPRGSMAINAIPWAEVLVDGARVGETPIGNITVPIGLHEVLFRHPELGERRLSVTVTTREPLKVGVDLRSK